KRRHESNLDNNTVDELTRKETTLPEEDITPFCGLPLSACWKRICLSISRRTLEIWLLEPTYFISKSLWPRLDLERTRVLLNMETRPLVTTQGIYDYLTTTSADFSTVRKSRDCTHTPLYFSSPRGPSY
ncbi:hypothetical protein EVAR_73560_1, partial [Eumeta japonica]